MGIGNLVQNHHQRVLPVLKTGDKRPQVRLRRAGSGPAGTAFVQRQGYAPVPRSKAAKLVSPHPVHPYLARYRQGGESLSPGTRFCHE